MTELLKEKEPTLPLVDLTEDSPDLDKVRVLGYFDAADLSTCTVPFCGGRRFRLPDGREVEITRQWSNAGPFDTLLMFLMGLYLVKNKPESETFVADISDATLVAAHMRSNDGDDEFYQGSRRGWKTTDDDGPRKTPLERIRSLLNEDEEKPAVIIVHSDAPHKDDDDVASEPPQKKARVDAK